jgi:hypothetical protein
MPKGINGYPVQTINLNAGQPGVRSSVKSVAEVALSDTDFSTGNAKKVEMPMAAIGGRGKGK